MIGSKSTKEKDLITMLAFYSNITATFIIVTFKITLFNDDIKVTITTAIESVSSFFFNQAAMANPTKQEKKFV